MPHLSPADKAWLLSKLRQRKVDIYRPCPECDNDSWNSPDELHVILAIEILDPGSRDNVRLDSGRPLLPVQCTNCGFTRLFDVRMLGYSPGVAAHQ